MNAIIIQARLGSSRLPKKVLLPFGNLKIIDHVLIRCLRSSFFKKVILAVPANDYEVFKKLSFPPNVELFAGEEADVLSRYYEAALKYNASTICRITSDCPFIDHEIIDWAYLEYQKLGGKLYVANTCPPPGNFPDGMDVEIFPFEYLEKAHHQELDSKNREHVTFQFWQNDTYKSVLLSLKKLDDYKDRNNFRLTVDYEEDYLELNNLACSLSPNAEYLSLLDLLNEIKDNNKLKKAHLRNTGWGSKQ